MYRRSFIAIFGFALFALYSYADAAMPYTLQSAMGVATEHSPLLQKAEAARDEGQWKGVEGAGVFLPTVTLSGTHFFEKKYQLLNINTANGPSVIPQIFPTSSATVEAKWIFFDGLSNLSHFKAAQSIKKAGESSFKWARFQLQHEVTLAYVKVIAAKKLEDVSGQNLKTLQNHHEQIKNLRSGGLATNYDILRVESQLSEAEADLLLAKDNTAISQEHLGQVLGIPESADAGESQLAEPNIEPIKNLTFNRDTNKRADLDALEEQVNASDQMDSANSRFWLPKLGLDAQYIKYNNLTDPLTDWDRYRSAYSVGFIMSWDIFNPREFAQSRQETYKSIQVQKSLIQANLQAPVDFAFWKRRYLYSATLYTAKKVDLERANETVRLSQAGFKAGVRTTTDVLDSELDLFRARAGIVNAQVNCLEAKLKLELALGETL